MRKEHTFVDGRLELSTGSERQNPYYWLLHNSAVDAGISSPILESVSVAASHNIIKINLNYQEEDSHTG